MGRERGGYDIQRRPPGSIEQVIWYAYGQYPTKAEVFPFIA